jgi:transcriptional regulator with XRE-family HTH domain
MPDNTDRHRPLGPDLAQRIRALRAQRGWSLTRMSGLCGVSRSMLSEIERGRANPTVAVALAIATALGMSLDELIAPASRPTLAVIRGEDPYHVYRSDDDCRIRTLSPLTADRRLEFYEIVLQRGGSLRSAPHFAGTQEYLTIRGGRVRVEVGAEAVELRRGDSIAYPADVEHAIVNTGRAPAAVYLIDTVP